LWRRSAHCPSHVRFVQSACVAHAHALATLCIHF
jgi:hypothetical protein